MHHFPTTENVIEPAIIQDVFCTDLVKVERLGPCARLTFATKQSTTEMESGVEYVVVARIVLPADMLATLGATLGARPDLQSKEPPATPGATIN